MNLKPLEVLNILLFHPTSCFVGVIENLECFSSAPTCCFRVINISSVKGKTKGYLYGANLQPAFFSRMILNCTMFVFPFKCVNQVTFLNPMVTKKPRLQRQKKLFHIQKGESLWLYLR